ncbi:MAG: hypothetical protein JO362_20315 [Streptomycetaceae bacterium]|nr:hypothetical protein [Streptomycetaceae bacterium]
MPKHDSKRKAQVRAHMARTGLPYTAAAQALEEATCRPRFADEDGVGEERIPCYEEVKRRLDEAGEVTDQEAAALREGQQHDPYRQAQAFDARAAAWLDLAGLAEGSVYHAACMLAHFQDQRTAAVIRFEHSIPTLFPRTMAAKVGLQCCQWCGRPWQADPTGACEHCPRLTWGPTPRSAQEAATGPTPQPVTREQLTPTPAYDD